MAQKDKKRPNQKQDSRTILTFILIVVLIAGAYFLRQMLKDDSFVDVSGNFAVHFVPDFPKRLILPGI